MQCMVKHCDATCRHHKLHMHMSCSAMGCNRWFCDHSCPGSWDECWIPFTVNVQVIKKVLQAQNHMDLVQAVQLSSDPQQVSFTKEQQCPCNSP